MIAIGNKNVDDVRLGLGQIAKVCLGDKFVYSPNLYKTVVKPNGWVYNVSTNTSTAITYPYQTGDNRQTLWLPVEEGASYLWKTKTKGDRYVVWYVPYDITPSLNRITNTTHPNITRGVVVTNQSLIQNRYIISPPTGTKWLIIYYALNTKPTGITINKL